MNKSALYLELLNLVNSGGVRLLDVPEMLREIRQLERRRGHSGRDRIDHPPNAHDDIANAAAGAIVCAMQAGRRMSRELRLACYDQRGDLPPQVWPVANRPQDDDEDDEDDRPRRRRDGRLDYFN